jgi:hypothetical protein
MSIFHTVAELFWDWPCRLTELDDTNSPRHGAQAASCTLLLILWFQSGTRQGTSAISVHATCLHQTKPDYTLRQGMSEICTCQVFAPNQTWLYFAARYVRNLYMPGVCTKPNLIILCGKVCQKSVHARCLYQTNLIILCCKVRQKSVHARCLYQTKPDYTLWQGTSVICTCHVLTPNHPWLYFAARYVSNLCMPPNQT